MKSAATWATVKRINRRLAKHGLRVRKFRDGSYEAGRYDYVVVDEGNHARFYFNDLGYYDLNTEAAVLR